LKYAKGNGKHFKFLPKGDDFNANLFVRSFVFSENSLHKLEKENTKEEAATLLNVMNKDMIKILKYCASEEGENQDFNVYEKDSPCQTWFKSKKTVILHKFELNHIEPGLMVLDDDE
jgi:hypothetical protein